MCHPSDHYQDPLPWEDLVDGNFPLRLSGVLPDSDSWHLVLAEYFCHTLLHLVNCSHLLTALSFRSFSKPLRLYGISANKSTESWQHVHWLPPTWCEPFVSCCITVLYHYIWMAQLSMYFDRIPSTGCGWSLLPIGAPWWSWAFLQSSPQAGQDLKRWNKVTFMDTDILTIPYNSWHIITLIWRSIQNLNFFREDVWGLLFISHGRHGDAAAGRLQAAGSGPICEGPKFCRTRVETKRVVPWFRPLLPGGSHAFPGSAEALWYGLWVQELGELYTVTIWIKEFESSSMDIFSLISHWRRWNLPNILSLFHDHVFFFVSVHWSIESIFLDCQLRSSPWAKPWLTCWAACMAQSRNGDTKRWCRGVDVASVTAEDLGVGNAILIILQLFCAGVIVAWQWWHDVSCLDMFGYVWVIFQISSCAVQRSWSWMNCFRKAMAWDQVGLLNFACSLCSWSSLLVMLDTARFPAASRHFTLHCDQHLPLWRQNWKRMTENSAESWKLQIFSWQSGNWEVKRCKNFRRDDLLEGVQPNHYEHRMGALNLKCQSSGASSPRLQHVLPVFLLCKAKALSLRAPWSPFSTCWYPGWSRSITRV